MKIPCEDCITLPMCRQRFIEAHTYYRLNPQTISSFCSIVERFLLKDLTIFSYRYHTLNQFYTDHLKNLIHRKSQVVHKISSTSIYKNSPSFYKTECGSEIYFNNLIFAKTNEKITCKKCLRRLEKNENSM